MSTQALKAVAQGNLPPAEGRNPYESLKLQLERSRGEFAKLVGGPQNADKFIRVVLNAVLSNPGLLDASRSSLIASCMRAAQDGLMPDGREAVLNIYSTKVKQQGGPDRWEQRAQYLPMVGGMVKKLYESGDVTYIDAACVYENDVFEFERGDQPRLVHKPTMGEPGEVIAAYAVFKLKSGEIKREVMPRRDLDKVRGASKSADSGPWKTWFDQQCIKSVLKRGYKQLPHADAFEVIEKYDNEALGYTSLGGQSAAEIAERTLNEHGASPEQAAVTHQPGEVLEPTLGAGKEAVSQQVQDDAQQQELRQEQQASEGVTPASEQDIATQVEVKMRAAKTVDALDLAADGGRAVKDAALRLRLDELYEALHSKLKPKQ